MGGMRHRNDDFLVLMAIGDAYGAGFEDAERAHPELWQQNTLTRYVRHPSHGCCGVYTDDTQAGIAVAEVLRSEREFSTAEFAEAFVRCFHRDPRNGYNQGYLGVLRKARNGRDLLTTLRTYGNRSEKNGGCMRAPPIGVLPDPVLVRDVACWQAEVTHDSAIGRYSASAVALMAHFALWTDEPFSRLGEFCLEHLRREDRHWFRFDRRWSGPVRNPATNTVHAVVDLLVHSDSLREVLLRGTDFRGDVDTVLAIALPVAACRFDDRLPAFLDRDLEVYEDIDDRGVTARTPKPYGVSFLHELGRSLMERYDRVNGHAPRMHSATHR